MKHICYNFRVTYRKDKIKMNFKIFIKKLLTDSCIFFSLIMLGYTVIATVMHVTEGEVLLDAARVLLFYVFSLLFAGANSLKRINALNKAVAFLLHFVVTAFAFYACFLLPLGTNNSNTFIGIAIYSVLYFIISAIVALFKARFKANAEVNEKYEAQFPKLKK